MEIELELPNQKWLPNLQCKLILIYNGHFCLAHMYLMYLKENRGGEKQHLQKTTKVPEDTTSHFQFSWQEY